MVEASLSLFDYAQLVVVALLMYAIVFGILKKVAFFDDAKVNSLVALLTAIIVSFSGVVTYTISYAVNWFIIILFILFVIILLMLFMGVKMEDISGMVNPKVIAGILIILFLIIFLKGFFALNNTFDTNNPQENPYDVDPSYNTGTDDITNKEINTGFFENLFSGIDTEVWYVIIFLLIIGGFVFLLGQ